MEGQVKSLSTEYNAALDARIAAASRASEDRASDMYTGFDYLIRAVYAPHDPGVLSDETVRSIMHDLIVAARASKERRRG